MAAGLSGAMQLRVLGPLEASVDGRSLALGGAKQRAVLAMLGLEANRTVSADRLVEGLWGEQPPASAAKMIQNYVWRLRARWARTPGRRSSRAGAATSCGSIRDSVDVCRFERLLAEASRAAEAGEPADAAREALALWRGAGAGGRSRRAVRGAGDPAARGAAARRRPSWRSTPTWPPAATTRSRARSSALVAEHPLRERLHAQRMLALYRCGRQAEALEAYRDARRTLVEEIGVEPGPELQRPARGDPAPGPVAGRRAGRARAAARARRAASPPLVGPRRGAARGCARTGSGRGRARARS